MARDHTRAPGGLRKNHHPRDHFSRLHGVHPAWTLVGQASAVLGLVLAVAVATLGGHGAGGAALEPQSFAAGVLPVLERAGCADAPCHGPAAAGGFGLGVGPPRDDLARRAALAAVLRYVVPGEPSRSALLRTVVGVRHQGAVRVPAGSCEARALERWVLGAPVPLCWRR